jgi:hypothetical protein
MKRFGRVESVYGIQKYGEGVPAYLGAPLKAVFELTVHWSIEGHIIKIV